MPHGRAGCLAVALLCLEFRTTGVYEDGQAYEETLSRTVVRIAGEWRYRLGDEYARDLERGVCPLDPGMRIEMN